MRPTLRGRPRSLAIGPGPRGRRSTGLLVVYGLSMIASLALGFDATFDDLHDRDGLIRLDARFLDFLAGRDAGLKDRLEAARVAPADIDGQTESELVGDLAPVLEAFVGELFGVEADLAAMRARRETLSLIFSV